MVVFPDPRMPISNTLFDVLDAVSALEEPYDGVEWSSTPSTRKPIYSDSVTKKLTATENEYKPYFEDHPTNSAKSSRRSAFLR